MIFGVGYPSCMLNFFMAIYKNALKRNLEIYIFPYSKCNFLMYNYN